jgi:hypothetical protein
MAEPETPESDHRQLGVATFNHVWRLLEQENRTREEDDEMLHEAHASAYHWLKAPECRPENRVRSEWICSRVYAVLGRAEPAVHHARRCFELCEQHPDEIEEFDLPFAYEALARAYAVARDAGAAERYAERGRELAQLIEDAEDRELLLRDLETVPRIAR